MAEEDVRAAELAVDPRRQGRRALEPGIDLGEQDLAVVDHRVDSEGTEIAAASEPFSHRHRQRLQLVEKASIEVPHGGEIVAAVTERSIGTRGDPEELDRLLTRLAEIRKEEGDTRDDFEIHVISYDAYTLDGIKRLEDKGVTDAIVGFRVPYIMGPDTEPLQTKIDNINRYAEDIISKVAL